MFRFSLETVSGLVWLSWSGCDWWLQDFVVVTFVAFAVDILLVDEAATLVVPHCEFVVALGFDAVVTYVADVPISLVVVAFHIAMYLVVVAVLNPLGEVEVHVDVVLLVLLILQDVLTELVNLTDQLWSFQLPALRSQLSFAYW